MSEGDEDDQVPRGLSWRRATYTFGPLRNALLAGLLLAVGLLFELLDAPDALAKAAFLSALPVGAWYFAQEGFEEFVEEREIGIEALMLFAAAGCLVFGLFEEAAALVFLYSLAEAIEELTFARTRSAIRALLGLAPQAGPPVGVRARGDPCPPSSCRWARCSSCAPARRCRPTAGSADGLSLRKGSRTPELPLHNC